MPGTLWAPAGLAHLPLSAQALSMDRESAGGWASMPVQLLLGTLLPGQLGLGKGRQASEEGTRVWPRVSFAGGGRVGPESRHRSDSRTCADRPGWGQGSPWFACAQDSDFGRWLLGCHGQPSSCLSWAWNGLVAVLGWVASLIRPLGQTGGARSSEQLGHGGT